MDNDSLLEDLKQFINSRDSQLEMRIDEKFDAIKREIRYNHEESEDGFGFLQGEIKNGLRNLRGKMKGEFSTLREEMKDGFGGVNGRIDTLREEMKDGFGGVGDAVEVINNRIDAMDPTIKRPSRLKQ